MWGIFPKFSKIHTEGENLNDFPLLFLSVSKIIITFAKD